MNKPHIHAEVIKAWADGAEIEFYNVLDASWDKTPSPCWNASMQYRIKPVPKPDIVATIHLSSKGNVWFKADIAPCAMNMVATFDGETHELKSVHMIGKPCPEKMEAALIKIAGVSLADAVRKLANEALEC